MEPIVIYVNIICGDVIGSAVIQGGKENAVEFSPPSSFCGTNNTDASQKNVSEGVDIILQM